MHSSCFRAPQLHLKAGETRSILGSLMRRALCLVTSDSTSTGNADLFCVSLSSKFLTRAEHLEKSDVTGKSDPYVVLSCQGRKYETKVKIRRWKN